MYTYKIKLDRVVDGDTIDANIDLGLDVSIKKRIRFAGINTPESRTKDLEEKARGLAAKDRLKNLLEGANEIQLKSHGVGKYGRCLGELHIDVANSEYKDPSGNTVANSADVWKEVVIPQVLADYTTRKRNELNRVIQHSFVIGFDYYYYSKKYWLHSWGNLLPYHYNGGNEFSYHNYNDGNQWLDYSGGIIFGRKLDKQLGIFAEGKYNKYWNREWYDFKFGVNYIIR